MRNNLFRGELFMSEDDIKIGSNIRAVRLLRRLTSDELADRMGDGTTGRTVRHYETGARSVSVPQLMRISVALDCSFQTLVQGLDPRVPDDTGFMEYNTLTPAEHAVFRRMATEWDGDRHALVIFISLYMSLPPLYRREAPLSLLAQVQLAISNGDISADDLPAGLDYMENACLSLYFSTQTKRTGGNK